MQVTCSLSDILYNLQCSFTEHHFTSSSYNQVEQHMTVLNTDANRDVQNTKSNSSSQFFTLIFFYIFCNMTNHHAVFSENTAIGGSCVSLL